MNLLNKKMSIWDIDYNFNKFSEESRLVNESPFLINSYLKHKYNNENYEQLIFIPYNSDTNDFFFDVYWIDNFMELESQAIKYIQQDEELIEAQIAITDFYDDKKYEKIIINILNNFENLNSQYSINFYDNNSKAYNDIVKGLKNVAKPGERDRKSVV